MQFVYCLHLKEINYRIDQRLRHFEKSVLIGLNQFTTGLNRVYLVGYILIYTFMRIYLTF